uniref:Uncharacterized protein n=1 Tax=viral metagenome TaxID=1070528 RepID=A0A6M3JL31_9ZZZZ
MKTREEKLAEAFENGTYIEVQFLIGWGAREKLPKEYLIEKELDTAIERGTRDLLNPDDLAPRKAIEEKKSEMLKYMGDWKRCLPSGIKSLNFIRKDCLFETLEYLRTVEKEVKQLAINWAAALTEAEKRYASEHPDKYSPGKYPSKQEIINGVVFNYTITNLAPPAKEMLGKEEYKKAIENTKSRISRAGDIIVEGFVTDLISNLKKLKKGSEEDGKMNGKVIKTSKRLVSLFKESLDAFILNDQIKKAVDELDELIEDDDPSELAKLIRDDDDLKKVVAGITTNIMGELKKIKDAPIKRAIDF